MALKARLGKADHDALEESLKSLYAADGDEFVLDIEGEDGLTGLRNKREELLRELKKVTDKFDGIDPDAAKQALADLETARREKLTADERHAEDLKKLQTDMDTVKRRNKDLFNASADRDLLTALANAKVRNEKIEDAAIILRAKHLKAHEVDGKPVWKDTDGKEADLNAYITGLQGSKADWFEPSTQPGGGASGSGNNNGGQDISKMSAQQKLDTLYSK